MKRGSLERKLSRMRSKCHDKWVNLGIPLISKRNKMYFCCTKRQAVPPIYNPRRIFRNYDLCNFGFHLWPLVFAWLSQWQIIHPPGRSVSAITAFVEQVFILAMRYSQLTLMFMGIAANCPVPPPCMKSISKLSGTFLKVLTTVQHCPSVLRYQRCY